ncbi:hypothetical protein [Vibrio ponticus]|uniref:hypothetical protein n=1 Tax=Vibrio ponticus TaxID=265668 RepID=UPI001115146E|nr:hypothetical protein [Vibrio ponticus]
MDLNLDCTGLIALVWLPTDDYQLSKNTCLSRSESLLQAMIHYFVCAQEGSARPLHLHGV